MGDTLAVSQFDDLLSEQSQAPTGITFGSLATSQGGDLGTLFSINHNRTARAGFVVQTFDAFPVITFPPVAHCVVIDAQGFGDICESLSAIEFEQCGRSLECFCL